MIRFLSYHNRLMFATGLISVALIACQVSMMQLLSIAQWHHFANMVISVALLGFGAAGTLLSLMRTRLLLQSDTLLPILMILSGVSMVMAIWISRSEFLRFDSYLLFVNRNQWLFLMLNYLLFFLPFLFGALALGIIFIKHVAEIGKFYFSNLLGSGIGALAASGLTAYLLPATLPAVVALIAILSGLTLLSRTNYKIIFITAAISFAIVLYRILEPVEIQLSQYKSISRTLQLPGARIIKEKPSANGFLQVVSANALRYAPGLSLSFTGEVPVRNAVFSNGDWIGPLSSWDANDTSHLLRYSTLALPYELTKREKVLSLHSGTGFQISHALIRGATRLDAVEPHRALMDLLMTGMAKNNDSVFYHPAVRVHRLEPRSFLVSTGKKYDLIELPIVGAFGGTSGLHAMQEEYSLTKEAFLQMWNHLEEDGVISISAWMDYPFRNSLKIAATLAETAEAAGIFQVRSHLAAVRSWATITFLLKKTPITPSDIQSVRAFCDQYSFDPALLPDLAPEERNFYNALTDSTFFSYLDKAVSNKREGLYQDYEFYIRPATDDKPYFSQFFRWRSFGNLSEVFGSQVVPFLELGLFISAITFLQLSLLALLLIIIPLFKIGWRGYNKLWTLIYFSGLGMGYMFLEIVFIQQFILFFGNPVFTASFVICVMMIGSGIGSYFSNRWSVSRTLIQRKLILVFLILLLYSFLLPNILQQTMGQPDLIKYGISVLIISVPAFLMGMPFPMGIKLLSMHEKNLPWAWGINGCMSVISAALATLIAVETGFTTVMILAAGAYGICSLSMYFFRTRN